MQPRTPSQALAAVLFALCAATLVPLQARAATPRVEDAVVSDALGGPAKSLFPRQTPEIFVRVKLADVPAGSKLRAEWISVNTGAAPPNYRIQGVERSLAAGAAESVFNTSKPTAGWPEGDYRVDLFMDGKLARQVTFKVVK